MPQLVRVGDRIINLAYVVSAEISRTGTVTVRFAAETEPLMTFDGDDAAILAHVFGDPRFVYLTTSSGAAATSR